jgi:regulator of sirC expression with transglutaminase-like and TPR domain
MEVPTPAEIRSVVRLLDDEHPVVREAVRRRVAAWGEDWERGVAGMETELEADAEMREGLAEVRRLRAEFRDERFREEWEAVLRSPRGEVERLEDALVLLARREAPPGTDEEGIRGKLDALARGFRILVPEADFRHLAVHLFGTGRFSGNEEDYYAPENSHLGWVLRERRGNPILLACVMMFVGRRVGLDIGGCNYPAHFLARHRCPDEGRLYLIDCFNEGRVFPAELLVKHRPPGFPDVAELVRDPAAVETILGRVLRNLDQAWERKGRKDEQRFVRELGRRLVLREW